MEKKYIALAIVWAIIGVIGFALMILLSSPRWTSLLSQSMGVIGVLCSIYSILFGATVANQNTMIGNQRLMIGNQNTMIGNQRLMIGNQETMIEILREIRDALRKS